MGNVSYSPYQDAANFGKGLGNAMVDIAQGVPAMRLKQMQAQRQAQMFPFQQERTKALTEESQAKTKEAGAREGLIKEQTKSESMGNEAKAMMVQLLQQGKVKEAAPYFLEWNTKNPAEAGKAAIQMLSMASSGLGGQGGPVDPANAAAATGMPGFVTPHNVPSGDIAINPTTGAKVAEAGFTLPAGADRFGPKGGTPIATNPKPAGAGGANPGYSMMAKLVVDGIGDGSVDPQEAIQALQAGRTNNLAPLANLVQKASGGGPKPGAGATPAQAKAPPVKVDSEEAYNKLNDGDLYIDSTGKTKAKGSK